MSQVDYFLKLDGIDGESKDDQFPKWIELRSWSWGAANGSTVGSSTSGSGAGNVTMQDIHCTAIVNAASPTISQNSTTGKHISWAELDCRKAGDTPQVFLKIKLTDVLVSSYHVTGRPKGELAPMDEFDLDYSKIEMMYGAQDAKGKVASLDKKMGYDLRINRTA